MHQSSISSGKFIILPKTLSQCSHLFSQEYRKAFQQQFPFLAKFTRINPITTIPPIKAANPTMTMTTLKIKSIKVHQSGAVVPNRKILLQQINRK
jgi:hypothetical protein